MKTANVERLNTSQSSYQYFDYQGKQRYSGKPQEGANPCDERFSVNTVYRAAALNPWHSTMPLSRAHGSTYALSLSLCINREHFRSVFAKKKKKLKIGKNIPMHTLK